MLNSLLHGSPSGWAEESQLLTKHPPGMAVIAAGNTFPCSQPLMSAGCCQCGGCQGCAAVLARGLLLFPARCHLAAGAGQAVAF